MKTTEENLKRVQNFLNELRILSLQSNGTMFHKDKQRIHDKYALPYSFFAEAQKMGYFTKIKTNQYSCSYKVPFDPIHAKHLIIGYNNRKLQTNIDKLNQHQNIVPIETIKKEKKTVPTVIKPPIVKKQLPKSNEKLKTFSLFWGLLKFNY